MTTTPLPFTDPPHDTVRPPEPGPTDDHKTRLSGGARYASAKQMRPARSAPWWATERGRTASARVRSPQGRPVQP